MSRNRFGKKMHMIWHDNESTDGPAVFVPQIVKLIDDDFVDESLRENPSSPINASRHEINRVLNPYAL